MTGLARLDVEAAGLSMAGAMLPANYVQASKALAECARIDICKEWADRAEALRSYARQADDPALLNHAMRIKARAVRRCGELLQQYNASPDNTPHRNRDAPISISRTEIAGQNGMSRHQRETAVRVANVPPDIFDSAVEAANPPGVPQLAEMGRKRRVLPSMETAVDEDFLSAREADEAISMIAKRVNCGLLQPSPGILACLAKAMVRASPKDKEAIVEAAKCLSELARWAK